MPYMLQCKYSNLKKLTIALDNIFNISKINHEMITIIFLTIELLIDNLHLAEIQKIIRKELKNKFDIYGFICKTNNKLYISSLKTLTIHFNYHINGSKSNILLQRAINKYNLQDFYFIVFKYCKIEKLLSRKQFYLDELKSEFNILQVAGFLLDFTHSKETITKMLGENHPMFEKTDENHPIFGISLIDNVIVNMKEAQKKIDRTDTKNS